jgi:adenosine deaminase
LNIQLEGAIQQNTLLMIAEQNEIRESLKHFDDWVRLIETPDYRRVNELTRTICSWLKYPDNLTRIIYDMGTVLSKQNVRYAEVGINTALFPELTQNYEAFLGLINDGRERARRAWGIELAWIFVIPREEPRRADELARWATTAAAQRGGVVALGLSGDENAQPIGQFERPFNAVEKKELPRVVRAGDAQGAEGVLKAIEALHPTRIVDGWGAVDQPEVLAALKQNDITVAASLLRAQRQGWVETVADYPLRKLYDGGVSVVVGSDMPSVYHTTLNDEYLAVVEQCGFTTEELEDLGMNAVRNSYMPEEAKAEMLAAFTQAYADARAEHLEAAQESS